LRPRFPKPQDGGKTFVFHIRKGIKFSNGKELKPSDVKYTFERLFKIGQSPNAGTWYNVIVGGDACVKTPATLQPFEGRDRGRCRRHRDLPPDEGRSRVLRQARGSVRFILPTGTPNKEVQIPPPGTGPYKFVEYNPNKEIKLVRNTNFKEWSKDAQPKGNPDVIVQKFGLSAEAEVTQVENGQADWMFDNPPATG
jgi:peptide/nickel transport system substrate-binding protein